MRRLVTFPARKRSKRSLSTRTRAASDGRKRRFLGLEALEERALMAMLVSEALSGTEGTTISGTVYEDLNSNGVQDNGENGLANWTVYLDLDNSGTLNTDAVGAREPSAVTNIDGDFVIGDATIGYLKPYTYRVNEELQAGWTATSPVSRDVVVTEGNDSKLTDFFNFAGGQIVGTVFNDLDKDGFRNLDPATGVLEPGLAGWTVFLDLNRNKNPLPDPLEPTTLTDANGAYSFIGLPPNEYEVFEVLPAGWEATKDTKQNATVVALQQVVADFGNDILTGFGSLRGTIWHDVNIDGIRNVDPATGEISEPGLAEWTVFLDLDKNGSADAGEPATLTNALGEYAFISLPAEVSGTDYEVTEIMPAGWYAAPGFDSRQTVTVFSGGESIAPDFANFTNLNGAIRGTIWNDVNRNGSRDKSLTGEFTEPGLIGWTVFLDLNGNRLADASEPTAITDVDGGYLFADLQVGDYEVVEILPSGWEVATTFDDNQTVTVFSGTESVASDFANFELSSMVSGSVSGTVWNDLNSNGLRDVDPVSGIAEPGLANWTVFVDLNFNGALDTSEAAFSVTSGSDGSYLVSGVTPGTVSIVEMATPGWRPTAPRTSVHTIALKSGDNVVGLDFGNEQLKDSVIRGTVFADTDRNGVRGATERGLAADITVYLDLNDNSRLDAGEPQTAPSPDLFFTPAVDEAGTYSFTHLAPGSYTVRTILPDLLSATPTAELTHIVTIVAAQDKSGVDTAAQFRRNEIHGVKFNDVDGDHQQDADEPRVAGSTIFLDLDRDNVLDVDEPNTVTADDGSYSFRELNPGAYVVREIVSPGYEDSYPTTVDGILWPDGTSNPAVGNVTPNLITASLVDGAILHQTVSLTLPTTGTLTNLVDVFLLFDDTGSFTYNSPIVRNAFPTIISQLQASLPGIDLGFGVGRFEEYGDFAYEYGTGRPFILNQPIVAANTAGYMTAIQAALNRTTPGYGGDEPETDIEALYQLVTGAGFDGNNNGTVLDSGPAGLASTQLNPGNSGDVPSFASFTADPANSILSASGTVGGAGFRSGALPIILTATDTGFAFQPTGETHVTGVGGITLPMSALTGTSRPTTPFGSGAGIQQTVTGLNALGALVIGLGTNSEANIDPRQGLEALSQLTGAINNSTVTIPNGTANPIAPGDPLYFQIASGFAGSVASGVVNAIQNAVTNVAVNIDIQASDPRVTIINHTGVVNGVGSGQTATFDIEIVGDGIPHRFDLQFVRAGTNVVLGSIPVVLGTPVPGDGYCFDDLLEGEIELHSDFGEHLAGSLNEAPVAVNDSYATNEDVTLTVAAPGVLNNDTDVDSSTLTAVLVTNPAHGTVTLSADGSFVYTPNADFSGLDSFTYRANDGFADSEVATVTLTVDAVSDAPIAAADSYSVDEDTPLTVTAPGVLHNDTDVDSSALTAVLVTNPAHGTVTLNADGSFVYTPAANFHGADSFTYVANDGALDSAATVVTLTVNAVNDAPVAVNDSYATNEDATLTVAAPGVLNNDTDVDSSTLTAVLVTNPAHGTVTLNADGSFVYTPTVNFHGADSFTYQANDGLLNGLAVTVAISVIPTKGSTKFIVVDNTARDAFKYDAAGGLVNSHDLNRHDRQPRGVAANKDGSLTWVVDATGRVFVYTEAGTLAGSWKASGVEKPEGIATDGTSVWIVDQRTKLVFYFAGAASRRAGETRATSRFSLDRENRNPMDVTTDGVHLWVVNDSRAVDKVFRYDVSGNLEGSWVIDPNNSQPTGLTIDPNDVKHLWIVDAGSDRVYQYDGAAARTSRGQRADSSFALAATNQNPQGIADPLPRGSLPTLAEPVSVESIPSGADVVQDGLDYQPQDLPSSMRRERNVNSVPRSQAPLAMDGPRNSSYPEGAALNRITDDSRVSRNNQRHSETDDLFAEWESDPFELLNLSGFGT